MKYIENWLAGLGIEYITPMLKAHGITTPKKLAMLTLRDMFDIGIEDAEDRKKLFFLIQRLNNILNKPTDGSSGPGTESMSMDSNIHDMNMNSSPSADEKAPSPNRQIYQQHQGQGPQNDVNSSLEGDLKSLRIKHKGAIGVVSSSDVGRDSFDSNNTASNSNQQRAPVNGRRASDGMGQPSAFGNPNNALQQAQAINMNKAGGDRRSIGGGGGPNVSSNVNTGISAASNSNSNNINNMNSNNSNNNNRDDQARPRMSSIGNNRNSFGGNMNNYGNNINNVEKQVNQNVIKSRSFSPIQSDQHRSHDNDSGHANNGWEYNNNNMNGYDSKVDFQGADDDTMQESFDYNGIGDDLVAHSGLELAGGGEVESADMAIRVVVRKRPISRQELARGERDVMDIEVGGKVFVHEPKTKVDLTKIIETQGFVFDDAFDHIDNNVSIYGRTVKPLVYNIFTGGKATCFAYGQTGSGKTFTMMGSKFDQQFDPSKCDPGTGLYVLAARDIFQILVQPQFQHLRAFLSCFEIYGGKLFDLLNDRSEVKCLEDAKQQVQIKGLSEHGIDSVESLLQLMRSGFEVRSVGSTGANAESSRSHLIMQIELKEQAAKVNMNNAGIARLQKRVQAADAGVARMNSVGKLSFIDLAGSERGADTTHNNKQTRMEGAEINTSLLALKEVIRSWNKKANHTPFRGSKLTQVLKDSFVGENTRTCMIACVSPSNGNCEHTINTLRYADRVKEHKSERQDDNIMNTDSNSNNNFISNTGGGNNNFNSNNMIAAQAQPSGGRPSSAGPGAYPYFGQQLQQQQQSGIDLGLGGGARRQSNPMGQGYPNPNPAQGNGRLSVGGGLVNPSIPSMNGNNNNNSNNNNNISNNSNSNNPYENRPATTSSMQSRESIGSAISQPSNSRQSLGGGAGIGGASGVNPQARRVSDLSQFNGGNGMNDRRISNPMQVPPPIFYEEEHIVNSYSEPISSNNSRLSSNMYQQNINNFGNQIQGQNQAMSPLLSSTDMIQRTVSLLTSHKGSIGYMVDVMRGEMQLVQNMENAEDRDSEVYVDKLEEILAAKTDAISSLRAELREFQSLRQVLRHAEKQAVRANPTSIPNPNSNPNPFPKAIPTQAGDKGRGAAGMGALAQKIAGPSSRIARK